METLREKYLTLLVLELTEDPLVYREIEREEVSYSGPWALCDRQLQKTAQQAADTAGSTAAGYGKAAGGIAGTLTPILTRQAQNPSGFSPNDVNNMEVSAAEGAGGAANSAANKAGLLANRTHNVGALSAVQDSAARAKIGTMANTNRGVQNENAELKQQQQQSALKQLGGLYGTDVGAQMGNAGQISRDVDAGVQAGNSGWLQNTMGVIGGLGKTAGSVMTGLYGNQGMMNS